MPVELVSIYEEEFFRFYDEDVVKFPLKSTLDFKDNELDKEVVSYIVWYFTSYFIDFAITCHNFGKN